MAKKRTTKTAKKSKTKMMKKGNLLTTNAGAPVVDNQNVMTAGPRGPQLLQDVWYYLSSVVDLEPIGQLSSWLFRVSRNRIIDKQRKHKPQSLDDRAYENEDGEWSFPEALLADENNPETEFERILLMYLLPGSRTNFRQAIPAPSCPLLCCFCIIR